MIVGCCKQKIFEPLFINCSGHHTILIPPSEVEANPGLWLTAVSQYKVRDTFCSYGKFISRIHSKPIDIRWIKTGSHPYEKTMFTIELYPVFYKYKMKIIRLNPVFLARALGISGLKIKFLIFTIGGSLFFPATSFIFF